VTPSTGTKPHHRVDLILILHLQLHPSHGNVSALPRTNADGAGQACLRRLASARAGSAGRRRGSAPWPGWRPRACNTPPSACGGALSSSPARGTARWPQVRCAARRAARPSARLPRRSRAILALKYTSLPWSDLTFRLSCSPPGLASPSGFVPAPPSLSAMTAEGSSVCRLHHEPGAGAAGVPNIATGADGSFEGTRYQLSQQMRYGVLHRQLASIDTAPATQKPAGSAARFRVRVHLHCNLPESTPNHSLQDTRVLFRATRHTYEHGGALACARALLVGAAPPPHRHPLPRGPVSALPNCSRVARARPRAESARAAGPIEEIWPRPS
jgi:hypothetical protein